MKNIMAIALLLCATYCYASDKATVILDNNGYKVSGGSDRVKVAEANVVKGFSKEAIPLDEKIAALEDKLNFYQLVKNHKIDVNKKIDAVYSEKLLSDVLGELLPGVEITFDGVSREVTIETMTVKNTDFDMVIDYLDNAAGVYFQFTQKGLTVKATP